MTTPLAADATLMSRLSHQKKLLLNQWKLPLITFLFVLPFGILYYETYAQLSVSVHAAVWVALAVAIGSMIQFYFQAAGAWARLFALARRIAQGDLTARPDGKLLGQFDLMASALMELTRSLGQVVSQVRSSSN